MTTVKMLTLIRRVRQDPELPPVRRLPLLPMTSLFVSHAVFHDGGTEEGQWWFSWP